MRISTERDWGQCGPEYGDVQPTRVVGHPVPTGNTTAIQLPAFANRVSYNSDTGGSDPFRVPASFLPVLVKSAGFLKHDGTGNFSDGRLEVLSYKAPNFLPAVQ